jgi:hypothetical protein
MKFYCRTADIGGRRRGSRAARRSRGAAKRHGLGRRDYPAIRGACSAIHGCSGEHMFCIFIQYLV